MTDARPTPPSTASVADAAPSAAERHPQVRHWLAQLDELVSHMDDAGWDAWARERARDVVAFFSQALPQLRRDEEGLLFPLVASRGDAAPDSRVEKLLQDHGWLDESWAELSAELRPIAEGFGSTDIDLLRRAAQVHATLWTEHLDLVERVIHPAALAGRHAPEAAAAARVARAAGSIEAEATDS